MDTVLLRVHTLKKPRFLGDDIFGFIRERERERESPCTHFVILKAGLI